MIVVGNNRNDPDYTFKSLIKSQINNYRSLNLNVYFVYATLFLLDSDGLTEKK